MTSRKSGRGQSSGDRRPAHKGKQQRADSRARSTQKQPARERVVYGLGPLEELIANRPSRIVRLSIRSGARGRLEALASTAAAAGIVLSASSADELERLAGPGVVHQGAVAVCGPYEYADMEDVIDAPNGGPILVLDGVTDPHNVGAICRSAYLFGAAGMLIGRDRSASVTAVATKASAGATELLPIAAVTNIARALEEIRDHDIWRAQIAATTDSVPLSSIDKTRRWALVLGAEGRGLRPLVAKNTDQAFVIPMAATGVGSLNVSVAAAIALYQLTLLTPGAVPVIPLGL